jgi:hypothetical protein
MNTVMKLSSPLKGGGGGDTFDHLNSNQLLNKTPYHGVSELQLVWC